MRTTHALLCRISLGALSALFCGVPAATAQSSGANVLYTPPQQTCGSMLGGIGTGFIELWPDGCFHTWSIFNRGTWAYRGDFLNDPKFRGDRLALGEMNEDALQLYIRTCPEGGKPIGRRLSVDGSQMNVYSYNTWMQCVEGIAYDASFPGATLEYKDSTLPLQVRGQFFSPVIPHETRISGTPGFYAVFTIKNTSNVTQEVSLASYLRNPLARGGDSAHRGADARKLRNTVATENGTTYLAMRTDADMPQKSTLGSLCLSITGGTPSWIACDFSEYLNGRTVQVTSWHQRYETPLREFRKTGKLPNTEQPPCPIDLAGLKVTGSNLPNMHAQPGEVVSHKNELAKLSDDQVRAIFAQGNKIASLRSILQQAEAVDPSLLDPAQKGRELVDILQQTVAQYAGGDGKANSWGDGMLASTITLKPGEERQIRLTLSWFFPNHLSPKGERNMGHMYANWFKDALEVNRYMDANYAEFSRRVNLFQQALRDTNLSPDLTAAVAGQLNTLIASSWWTADGKMGVWEGLGCCGLNSATVLEEGSHPIAALFPEYQKTWTGMAIDYQSDTTGRLYILLPSDLDKGSKNQGYGYVDRNCQFVWMICRDYLWFGDKKYLDTYYPHVVKAIGVFEGMDSDGDGLPDQHTESNTYDTWALQGVPSYFCSLWIGTLRCGIRMANDAGDTANAAKWQGILDKAIKSFNAKLWNGEYYSLWINGNIRDEGCMADQLAGEHYTHLMGLGDALPSERVREVLAVIYKYNFDMEQGLYNGIYPPGRKPRMPTYQNVQGEGNWTGIEFNTAAMLIDHGMVDEGLNLVKAVQRRYVRAGRFQNHEECGPRYSRPMSIWATLLAATGFKVDAPRQALTIAPPAATNPLKAPWVSATGLGQFVRTGKSFDLACTDGQTSFRTLKLNVPVTQASLNGKPMACKTATEAGLTVVTFAEPVTVAAGQTLSLK